MSLWSKLKSLYMKMSVTNSLLLKCRFKDLCIQECNLLKAYIDEFSSVVMDRKNIYVVYDEEDLAITLLCSLPYDFTGRLYSMIMIS